MYWWLLRHSPRPVRRLLLRRPLQWWHVHQVRKARRLKAAGWKFPQIAKELDVSIADARYLVKRG